MGEPEPILDYGAPLQTRELRMEEGDGVVRVKFPVTARWVIVGRIALWMVAGLGQLFLAVSVVAAVWILVHRVGFRPGNAAYWMHDLNVRSFFWDGLDAVICFGVAGYMAWKYRRWGRVPRVLVASSEGLVETRLGWFSMRERNWRAEEIIEVKLRGMRSHLWGSSAAFLLFYRKDGSPIYFRLVARDRKVQDEIARRVASVLGRPLTIE